MDSPTNHKPSPWLMALFAWFCKPEYREDLEGDLLERFYQHEQLYGSSKAKWLFIVDVLFLFRPGIIRSPFQFISKNPLIMKRVNWITLLAVSALFVLVIILPFLPGPSNNIVVVFSALAQMAGFFGLLLVPIGLVWLFYEIKNRKREKRNWKLPYILAIVSLVIIGCFYFLLITAAFLAPMGPGTSSTFAFLLGIAVGIAGVYRSINGIKRIRRKSGPAFSTVPLYLLIIPLIAFATTRLVVAPLSNYSRNHAIQKSRALINAIEEYKNKTGHYPASLQELPVTRIPSPSIMGIQNFRYNKIDDHYSISFSQWLEWGSLEQLVLYDKNGIAGNRDKLPPYDYKLDLHRINGAFAVFDTKYENWKYYQLD